MKPRLLFIITSLEIGGGAERAISNLSKHLDQVCDVFILTFYDFKEKYPFSGTHVSINQDPQSITKIFLPFKMYKRIKEISPDIIISFMDHVNFLTIIAKLLFRMKIPLIVSVRTNPKIAYREENKHFNPLIRYLYSLKTVNKVVAISKSIEEILNTHYKLNKSKTITIYNAINREEIIGKSDGKLDQYSEVFNDSKLIKFITVGRLLKQKQQDLLIRAFSKVQKELKNSKLFILGEGSMRTSLEMLIKEKDLENQVFLLGIKENPFPYIKSSTIFVSTSQYEGFGIAILEALALGIPIISTRTEGPLEVLGEEYGIMIDIGDIENLIEKMLILGKNEEIRKEYSKKSLERIQLFDISDIVQDWVNLINSTLNEY